MTFLKKRLLPAVALALLFFFLDLLLGRELGLLRGYPGGRGPPTAPYGCKT